MATFIIGNNPMEPLSQKAPQPPKMGEQGGQGDVSIGGVSLPEINWVRLTMLSRPRRQEIRVKGL